MRSDGVPGDCDTTDRCLRDIVALSMLPALWLGAEPSRVAESLAASLFAILEPRLAFVHVPEADGRPAIDLVQLDRHTCTTEGASRFRGPILDWLGARDAHEVMRLPAEGGGPPLRVAARPLGSQAEQGVIAAAFEPGTVLGRRHELVLNVAAAQAVTALRNAQLVWSLRRLAEERERSLGALRESEDRAREANAELARRLEELQRANAEIRRARLAALNVMEDALQARGTAESLAAELQEHRLHLERLVEQRTAELKASHQRLHMSERLSALGTLSAGLGHDMGNLLIPVRVRMESLAALPLPREARAELEGIRSSLDYLQKLASGLRLLALDPGSVASGESVDVHAWWREATVLLRTTLPRGVTLRGDLPEGECRAAIPQAALMQAVFNLVQNAGEAMREQGGVVCVRAERRGREVRISISDTGPGMTEEVKRRCIEPFFTTKSRGISTGLGLSLVYGLVQRAGGRIELESALGQGTTFTLHLLAPEPRPDEPRRLASVALSDPRLRAIVAAELRALSFDVRFGEETLAEADLVVADRADLEDGVLGRALLLGDGALPAAAARVLGARPSLQALRQALRELASRGEVRETMA